MLVDKSLRELLDAFASSAPTPGGGSAAALASAVGASLLQMVASLSKTRSNTDDDRAALVAASAALTGIRAQLTDAIDADSGAYDQVVAAYTLAKSSAAEQSARKSATQRALRAATDVPLGVARLSVQAMKEAKAIAGHGHRGASSDIGVAIALLAAGQRGALLNVRINLGGIDDAAYASAVKTEMERLAAEASSTAAAAEGLMPTAT